jgi:hypothetical protein
MPPNRRRSLLGKRLRPESSALQIRTKSNLRQLHVCSFFSGERLNMFCHVLSPSCRPRSPVWKTYTVHLKGLALHTRTIIYLSEQQRPWLLSPPYQKVLYQVETPCCLVRGDWAGAKVQRKKWRQGHSTAI